MECKDVSQWLRHEDGRQSEKEADVLAHALDCQTCARMLLIDRKLEVSLRTGLRRLELPAELRRNIALLAREKPRPHANRPGWFFFPAAVAAGLALLIFFFNPFTPRLDSLEEIARLAEKAHMAAVPMEFAPGEVKDAAAWFKNQGTLTVAPLALAEGSLALQGGRAYRLGRVDTAYLLYRAAGKRYSLFTMPAGKIPFQPVDNQLYRYPVNRCVIEVWKEAGQIYILVS